MPYEAEIKAAADQNNIPFNLLYAQVGQESSYNPTAQSHCGARGLLQLMPGTGHEMGLKEGEFFDIEKNLNAGAKYLKRQFLAVRIFIRSHVPQQTNGFTVADYWKLALAAYNGGFGYVMTAVNLCRADAITLNTENILFMLGDPRCQVKGHHPDHKQMTDYVSKIFSAYKRSIGA